MAGRASPLSTGTYRTCPLAAADDVMGAHQEAASVRKMKESIPYTPGRQMQPWEEDTFFNSWKLRSQLPQNRFSYAELESFIFDYAPLCRLASTIQAEAAARSFYLYASGESRLVVTDNHMSIGERCKSKKARLDRSHFKYSPMEGDDMGLFFRLLLLQLPLSRIEPAWSSTES